MNVQPSLTLSTHDVRRLEALLQNMEPSPTVSRLEAELARARWVEPTQVPAQVVTMNSRLRCIEVDSGRVHELQLVYPHEADAGAGRISILAPVGSAVLGLSVGDAIDWPVPGGRSVRLRVTDVIWQPEAHGQFE